MDVRCFWVKIASNLIQTLKWPILQNFKFRAVHIFNRKLYKKNSSRNNISHEPWLHEDPCMSMGSVPFPCKFWHHWLLHIKTLLLCYTLIQLRTQCIWHICCSTVIQFFIDVLGAAFSFIDFLGTIYHSMVAHVTLHTPKQACWDSKTAKFEVVPA